MRGRLVALATAVIVLLTGCRVDVGVAVEMAGDGSGTITVTAITDAELVAAAPGLAGDLRLDDLRTAGWIVDGPDPTADGGLRVQLTHTFASPDDATGLLASLNGPGGPFQGVTFHREVDGSRADYAVDGSLQLVGGLDAFSDAQVQALGAGTPFADALAAQDGSIAGALGVTLRLDMPVAASSTNGTRDGDTLRWDVPLDGSAAAVQYAGSVHPSSAGKRLLALLALGVFLTWVVVSVAFVAFVLRHRRRAS